MVFLQSKAKRDELLMRSYEKGQALVINAALRASDQQLSTLVRDYALWDEMVNYVTRPDSNWSKANLATFTVTHQVAGIWIFDKFRNLTYSKLQEPKQLESSKLFTDSLFQHILKVKQCRYFIKQGHTLYEFSGGTIHPTTDTLWNTNSSGYFFVAKALDKKTLKILQELSGSQVIIQFTPGITIKANDPSQTVTLVPLASWNKEHVAYLNFIHSRPLLKSYLNLTSTTGIFYFIFALFLLFLTSVVLYLWVYRPLRRITESLALENTSLIDPLSGKNNEFGQIAFMIERFFLQKKELAQIIHEKNDALAAFADAESKNTAILTAIPDHLFRVNLFGIISDFHINKKEEFTISTDSLLGKNIDEVFPTATIPTLQVALKEVNKTRQIQTFDFSTPLKNGLQKYYDTTVTLTEMGDYLVIIRNITIRKEAEIALQHMLQKEGELSRIKTHFISTVSHEFRTPLSAISSNLEMLEMYDKKWTDEKKSIAFSRIQESLSQLISLLDSLSIVAKDQTGKFRLNPAEFDLEALCRVIISDNLLIYDNQVEIKFDYRIPRKSVVMDKELLRYIFNNLISNALKFSPSHSTIQVIITKTGTRDIEFRIEDEGVGIPEKDLALIYEPFHRGENANEYPGSGLGLSIVKRCVETHLGSILIESKPGKGTRVVVHLPEVVFKS